MTPALLLHDGFLQHFNLTIVPHLTERGFNVKRLLRLIGMSRTDLHRKLSRTVGMSATEYLRHLRLQKAAKLLLEQPGWSIYKVALEVGFYNQSYFGKRFREVFGVCPVAWREREGKLEHT